MPSVQSTPPTWWVSPDGTVPDAPDGYYPVDPTTGDPNISANDPGDPPSYPTDTGWGGADEIAAGVSGTYTDDNQGASPASFGQYNEMTGVNTTGTSGTAPYTRFYVGCWSIPPGTMDRRFNCLCEWCADSSGDWVDWDGTTVPSGATLMRCAQAVDEAYASPASVGGTFPTSATSGAVTSPCPAVGRFTFLQS